MKNLLRFIFLSFTAFLIQNCFASYENFCLLTGTLLQTPEQMIRSMTRVNANGQFIPNSEYEVSEFKLKVLINQSEKAGRTDSGCQLPNNKPYELSISLPRAYGLVNAKKGDTIKLMHVITDYRGTNPQNYYILQE